MAGKGQNCVIGQAAEYRQLCGPIPDLPTLAPKGGFDSNWTLARRTLVTIVPPRALAGANGRWILWGDRKTAKFASHFPTTRQVRLLPSFLRPTDYPEDACSARRCRPASPWRLNDCRLGPNDLNVAGDGSTISAARLFQSRSIAGVSRRPAVGLSRPGIWRAQCSSAASARGGPATTWRRYGLATGVLELEETRLGVGVRQLRLTPVPRHVLGSWSLEPTTRLGAGALAMILPALRTRPACVLVVGADALFFANATGSLQRISPHHSGDLRIREFAAVSGSVGDRGSDPLSASKDAMRVNSALRFRHLAGRFRRVEGAAAELPGAATDKLRAHAGSWSRRGGTRVRWTSLILCKFHRSESAAYHGRLWCVPLGRPRRSGEREPIRSPTPSLLGGKSPCLPLPPASGLMAKPKMPPSSMPRCSPIAMLMRSIAHRVTIPRARQATC